MNEIARMLDAVLASGVSTFFFILIVIIFLGALLSRVPGFSDTPALASLHRSGAGLMTTLGVLGTFTGIFIGLLDFEVARIDASIPRLLDGLKIAFSTSIAGLGAATLFKIVQGLFPLPHAAESDTTPAHILSALRDIDHSVTRSSDRMAGEFREFAQTMANDNSAALIDALGTVIRDFNTKLHEQFGENFKQLNEAVGALVVWQDQYRAHVERLEARLEAAVEALDATRTAVGEIPAQLQKIPALLAPLDELLTGLRAMVAHLDQHLAALVGLKAQAVEAFPIIEDNMRKLTAGFGGAVTEALDRMAASVDEQRAALDHLRDGYVTLRETAVASQQRVSEAVDGAASHMQQVTSAFGAGVTGAVDRIAATVDEQQRTLDQLRGGYAELLSGYTALRDDSEKMQHGFTRAIDQALAKTEEEIAAQFRTLDAQMQKELGNAITSMGRHLASLSRQFVEDYQPLTDRLRTVVRLAEGVQARERES